MARTSFFVRGMGTAISKKIWRYKRKDVRPFVNKYQALSIPAYDVERIKEVGTIQKIRVETQDMGTVHLPIEYLPSGTFEYMSKWQEPNQYFIPICYWE